nr:MAG TPA: hypothetical protein [Caudoviricetes sp.]
MPRRWPLPSFPESWERIRSTIRVNFRVNFFRNLRVHVKEETICEM